MYNIITDSPYFETGKVPALEIAVRLDILARANIRNPMLDTMPAKIAGVMLTKAKVTTADGFGCYRIAWDQLADMIERGERLMFFSPIQNDGEIICI